MKNWKTSAEQILTTGPVVPVIVVNKLEHAVPMAKALVAGGVSWEPRYYHIIAAAFREASRQLGIPVVWGAVWDRQLASLHDDLGAEVLAYTARHEGKDFLDYVHFELRAPINGATPPADGDRQFHVII